MHRELPNNDAWITRFKDFKAFVDAHDRMPEEDLNGGPEDTLHTWLERQRAARANGTLAKGLDAILDSIKGAFTEPAPTVQERLDRVRDLDAGHELPTVPAKGTGRLERLEHFAKQHGRLPAFGGTEPDEQNLYGYLNSVIRVRYRRGELDPIMVSRLKRIPGIFDARAYNRRKPAGTAPKALSVRAQARIAKMEELIAFCTAEGRLPQTHRAGAEPALYDYLRRRVRPAYAEGLLDDVTAKRLLALPGVLTKAPKASRHRSTAERLAA